MSQSKVALLASGVVMIIAIIIVGLFGVVPLPEYSIYSSGDLRGSILLHIEDQTNNIVPPAPDILDACIVAIDVETLKEEEIVCSGDLYSYSYDIYFYDAQIYQGKILIRYWEERINKESGLLIDMDTGKILEKIDSDDIPREASYEINVNGEKLVDPYESSDYNSRTIGIYYQKGIEIVEVFKSKAPSNYYFHSLMWSPDGEHIVALDSEDNLLVFSKNKKINASKIVFDQEIDIDGEREYLSLLGWTN